MDQPHSEREAGFGRFLKLLGELNYAWSNTESLLIHLIAGLTEADKEVSVVIYLTLSTTRARIDLVQRLAKLKDLDEARRDDILGLTDCLQRLSGLRNHYNHCIYSFDSESGSAKTILMRIADRKTEIRMGRAGNLDEDALQDIRITIEKISALNRAFWKFFVDNDMA